MMLKRNLLYWMLFGEIESFEIDFVCFIIFFIFVLLISFELEFLIKIIFCLCIVVGRKFI